MGAHRPSMRPSGLHVTPVHRHTCGVKQVVPAVGTSLVHGSSQQEAQAMSLAAILASAHRRHLTGTLLSSTQPLMLLAAAYASQLEMANLCPSSRISAVAAGCSRVGARVGGGNGGGRTACPSKPY